MTLRIRSRGRARAGLRTATVTAAAATLLAAALTACSGEEGGSGASEEESHDHADTAVSHIHGLGIDPADGRLYVATHEGVLVVGKGGKAKRVSDEADYMGFTVAGPKHFLGSGHPAPDSGDHANRGLIESKDAGKTWKTRSLGGEVDFHALEYAHDTIYGYDSSNGMLRVSKDGTTWDERAKLGALDLAVSPKDPDVVLATTQQGIVRSTDGGRTFGDGTEPALAFLSWAEPEALYGLGPSGGLSRSTDGGKTWKKTGTVPGGGPQALTAVDADRVLAATEGGVYESRDGGKTFTERLPVEGGGH